MRLRQSMLSRRPITVIGLAAAHIGTTGGVFGFVQAFEYANSHEVSVWSAAISLPLPRPCAGVFLLVRAMWHRHCPLDNEWGTYREGNLLARSPAFTEFLGFEAKYTTP